MPIEDPEEANERRRARLRAALERLSALGVSQRRAAEMARRSWPTVYRQVTGQTRPVDPLLVERLEEAVEQIASRRASRAAAPPGAMPVPPSVAVPLLGRICAGDVLAAEVPMGAVEVMAGAEPPEGRTVAVVMAGDSMAPEVLDGDIVLLGLDLEPAPGDLVAVTLPGEGTILRRLEGADGQLALAAAGDDAPAVPLKPGTPILGVVVGLSRRFR